jgi:hypothetical protein
VFGLAGAAAGDPATFQAVTAQAQGDLDGAIDAALSG